jgi:hypothetical protein
MFLIVVLLAAAPLTCPKGTSPQKIDGEESCVDGDGKLHGPQEYRDDKGVLLHRASWDHGVALSQVSFFPDGSKQMTRSWSQGKRDGAWDLFDEHGKRVWHREYSAGRLVKESLEGQELDGPVIKQVISAHKSEITYCYEKQLQKNAKLAGRVTPAFTIGPDGDVTEVRFDENTLSDSEVGKCISEKVKKWEFPRPADGASIEISFPWNFQPSKHND